MLHLKRLARKDANCLEKRCNEPRVGRLHIDRAAPTFSIYVDPIR